MAATPTRLRSVPAGHGLHVVITGELDSDLAELVGSFVLDQLRDSDRALVVDLRGVKFCNSDGLDAMIRMRKRCEETGRGFRILYPIPAVRRVFDLAGVTDYLNVELQPTT